MKCAVIMAGGMGTRLWPLSRRSKPKQFQKILSDRTLLQETYDRIKKILPDQQIFISTTPEYCKEIKKELPTIPARNYIVEPAARNTTAAHGFIAIALNRIYPNCTFTTIPSDHIIQDVDKFIKVTEAAFDTIENNPEYLVTLGIKPTAPETGLGYIKVGDEKFEVNGEKVYKIAAFYEKPNLETAKKYFKTWGYLWSSANYFFKTDTLLAWIKKYRPETYQTLMEIDPLLGKLNKKVNADKFKSFYESIQSEQLANSIIEQKDFDKALVIPADLGWSDVGNWSAIFDILSKGNDNDGNIISRGNHIDQDSEKCLVYGDKKVIATLGLKNVIVVDSPDALLIADKTKVQDLKTLLSKVEETYL